MNEEKKSVSIPAVNVFLGAVVVLVGVGYVMYKKGRTDEINEICAIVSEHGQEKFTFDTKKFKRFSILMEPVLTI